VSQPPSLSAGPFKSPAGAALNVAVPFCRVALTLKPFDTGHTAGPGIDASWALTTRKK
jgi:hypothetical protein